MRSKITTARIVCATFASLMIIGSGTANAADTAHGFGGTQRLSWSSAESFPQINFQQGQPSPSPTPTPPSHPLAAPGWLSGFWGSIGHNSVGPWKSRGSA